MPLADYQRLLLDARGYQILSYDDLGDSHHSFLERYVADGNADPLLMLEQQGFRETLVRATEALPGQESTVSALYYEEELKQREIGEVRNVSESRVCPILTDAIARLRVALKGPWSNEQ